jgi:hypothetical protein
MPHTGINPVTYFTLNYTKKFIERVQNYVLLQLHDLRLKGTRFASIPAIIKFHPSQSTPQYYHEYLFSGNLPG